MEKRVAIVPQDVAVLKKKGIEEVVVAKGAGVEAGFSDQMYEKAGATIVPSNDQVWKQDVVVSLQSPSKEDLAKLESRKFIGLLDPLRNPDKVEQLAKQKATVLSMDMLMRQLSRGQAFDVLSSQHGAGMFENSGFV